MWPNAKTLITTEHLTVSYSLVMCLDSRGSLVTPQRDTGSDYDWFVLNHRSLSSVLSARGRKKGGRS
jgi:hypothetical protein